MQIQTIKSAINDRIAQEQIGIDAFDHLVKVFRPFVGKKISQRMVTALNKDLPKGFANARFQRIASLIQVILIPEVILGKFDKTGRLPYDNRITFLLGYETYTRGLSMPDFRIGSAGLEHSGFAYYNISHSTAAIERNKIRRTLLRKVIKMAGYANAYATGIALADKAKSELIELVGYQMEVEMTKILAMTDQK